MNILLLDCDKHGFPLAKCTYVVAVTTVKSTILYVGDIYLIA